MHIIHIRVYRICTRSSVWIAGDILLDSSGTSNEKMKKFLLYIVLSLVTCLTCVGQGIRLHNINDTLWYSLDKKAAQTLIYKANKGDLFDEYVMAHNKIMREVLEAKVKADKIQEVQQESLDFYKVSYGECSIELLKYDNRFNQVLKDSNKFKKQRNVSIGLVVALAISLGIIL